jgi:hypothetical protein
MRNGYLRSTYWKEDIPELPDPGTPVKTDVLVKYHKRVWSIAQKPDKDIKTFKATWRFPSVRLWRKTRRYNDSYEQEEKLWKYLLLDCSFVSPITMDGEELSEESCQKIMDFWPGMIPAALMQKYLATTAITSKEDLRIERECFQLWATEGGSIKDPHPILGDVIWSMSLYESFGISLWDNLDDMHVKIYAVMRKALSCHSQSIGINKSAGEALNRARAMTGIGPGGSVGRR